MEKIQKTKKTTKKKNKLTFQKEDVEYAGEDA